MAIENTISQDLADLLVTKNFDPVYTDELGKDSSPGEAKTMSFDWVGPSGKNYGTAVAVIGDANDLLFFFGDNLGKSIEDPNDKNAWFQFLEQLGNFAVSRRYTFSPKDLMLLKHTMAGMAAIKEGLFEGYYGTKKISYVGEQTDARLVIKHNRMIGEDDKRYRYVESLFIETVDGERFKLPFTKLTGGRAMLEHVRQGGRPYDVRGCHIGEIVKEMAVLSRFNRASQQRVFEGVTQELVETAVNYYHSLQENLKRLATGRGYNSYFETWTPADINEQSALVEDLRTLFVEQTLDARIEAALPTLAKLQQQGNAMKEVQVFENWINQLSEGTWALPETPEQNAKLKELMSKELIVGPDGTNATEQLYDVIGDDELFDRINDLAERDPRANLWDDTDVQQRLQELGIQMPSDNEGGDDEDYYALPMPDGDRDEQPPIAKQQFAPQAGVKEGGPYDLPGKDYDRPGDVKRKQPSGDHNPYPFSPEEDEEHFREIFRKKREAAKQQGMAEGNMDGKVADIKGQIAELEAEQEQNEFGSYAYDTVDGELQYLYAKLDKAKKGVAESNELAQMLKYAGIQLNEGVLNDSTGSTFDHICDRFRKEITDFEATGELDDNLYDALYDYYFDDMPYGTKKARTGDPYEWVAQRLYADLGIDESDSGMIMPEADPISTFEAMPDVNAIAEGSCNMTAEGDYCPEHGLAECGMYEMGTVAGSIAPVMGEQAVQDPINYNAAITGSYYEAREGDAVLARIKSLALLK